MRTPRDSIYAGHRYPAEIISYAVWLYFWFPLSLRMVEEMLAARGISVTHETIRQWASNSAGNSPTGSVGERLVVATNGTSMRWTSASPEEALALACRRPGRLRSRCSRPLCYTSRAFDSPASARGPRSCGCFDAIDSPSKRPAIAGRAPSLRPRGDRACGFIRAASATICNRSCTLTCQTTRTTPLVRSTMQPAHRPREDVPELLQ
jgi:hypothetical protein